MRFKHDKQRKAVMAKLNQGGLGSMEESTTKGKEYEPREGLKPIKKYISTKSGISQRTYYIKDEKPYTFETTEQAGTVAGGNLTVFARSQEEANKKAKHWERWVNKKFPEANISAEIGSYTIGRRSVVDNPEAVKMLSMSKEIMKPLLEDARYSALQGKFYRGETQKYNEAYLRLGNEKYDFIGKSNKVYTELNRKVRMMDAYAKKALYNFLKDVDDPSYEQIVRYDTEFINDTITLGLEKRVFTKKY